MIENDAHAVLERCGCVGNERFKGQDKGIECTIGVQNKVLNVGQHNEKVGQ